MLAEMLALKLQDGSDQLLTVVRGHMDKAGMEAVGVAGIGYGVDTQHFKCGLKDHLARKKQRTGKDGVLLEGLVECNADAAAAEIDGSFDERRFRRVGFLLQADRDGDSDAIKLTAISR